MADFDNKKGDLLWKYTVTDKPLWKILNIIFHKNVVWMTTWAEGEVQLIALDIKTGKLLRTQPIVHCDQLEKFDEDQISLYILDNVLYHFVGITEKGVQFFHLAAVDTQNGKVLWTGGFRCRGMKPLGAVVQFAHHPNIKQIMGWYNDRAIFLYHH